TKVSKDKKDPFRILVSCILSLRTKDKVTISAFQRLFGVVKSPEDILKLKRREVEKLIYPVGFYRNKAVILRDISQRLINEYKGRFPKREEDLLSFKGVGRKTANLVLGLAFGIPAICVDTHVHRISNRLGWVKTNRPQETEFALKKIIPQKWWIELNTLFVVFGQNVCLPVSPLCGKCSVSKYCKKVGLKHWR
ncbi:MAG: endonuclease III, partial [Candidatus Omnitrophota bacterium]